MKKLVVILTVLALLVLPAQVLAAPPEIMADRNLWTGGDQTLTSWAKDAIDDAVRYEFFTGYPRGEVVVDLGDVYGSIYPEAAGHKVTAKVIPEFRPYSTVTRAEFATILARATGFGDEDYKPGAGGAILAQWVDLDPSAWYWRYLDALAGRGVIQPDDRPGREFRPGEPITRVEIAVWSARAARAYGIQPPVSDISQFPDAEQIATGYRMDVAQAVGLGVIKGRGDGLHPYDTATRAEAATMLMRLVRQFNKHLPTNDELIRAFDANSDSSSIFLRDNPKWSVITADWSQLAPWNTEGMLTLWYVPEPLPCTPMAVPGGGVRHRAACREMDGTPSGVLGARADSLFWYSVCRALRVVSVEATDRMAKVTYEMVSQFVDTDGFHENQGKASQVLYLRREGGRWKVAAVGAYERGPAGEYDPTLAQRLDGKTLKDIP